MKNKWIVVEYSMDYDELNLLNKYSFDTQEEAERVADIINQCGYCEIIGTKDISPTPKIIDVYHMSYDFIENKIVYQDCNQCLKHQYAEKKFIPPSVSDDGFINATISSGSNSNKEALTKGLTTAISVFEEVCGRIICTKDYFQIETNRLPRYFASKIVENNGNMCEYGDYVLNFSNHTIHKREHKWFLNGNPCKTVPIYSGVKGCSEVKGYSSKTDLVLINKIDNAYVSG